MGNPFSKGPLPSFGEQGGEGVTNVGQMPTHLLCTLSRGQVHEWHNVHPPFSPVFYSWPKFFTTSAPTKPAHPPECAKKEKKNREDFGYGFQPSSPWARRPIFALFVTLGPEPSNSRPTSISVRTCLFIGSTRPPFLVTHDSSDCVLVMWSLE